MGKSITTNNTVYWWAFEPSQD